MKKLILFVLLISFVFLSSFSDAAYKNGLEPKWSNIQLWRDLLKEGFLENHVINILGEPVYRYYTHDFVFLCYQTLPTVTKDHNIILPETGFVKLSKTTDCKNNNKPVRLKYIVKEWTEPSTAVVKSSPQSVRKYKKIPKRKLEKWENIKTWQMLLYKMPKDAVKRILGNPVREETQVEIHSFDTIWYFHNIKGSGEVRFEDGLVQSWAEPFWLELDKELYNFVDPDTKTVSVRK